MESPFIGAYPAPQDEGPLENTFEEVIKAAAGAANPYVGVALTGAAIANNILNWINDITDDPNKKRWDWAHAGYVDGMDPNWAIRWTQSFATNQRTA